MFRHCWRQWSALALSSAVLAACTTAEDIEKNAKANTADRPGTTMQIVRNNLAKAQRWRAEGNYSAADNTLRQLVMAVPDDPAIIGEYGKVLVEEGRTKEAVPFLNKAILLNGSDWSLYSALGVAFDGNDSPLEARSAYERALKLRPDEKTVLNNYALSRLMAGDPAGALDLMKQAAAGSNDPKIVRNLAMVEALANPAEPAPASAPALARQPTGSDFEGNAPK